MSIVIHVTKHFWPPRGGQELLIIKMCEAANDLGRKTLIIQPFQFSLLKPDSYRQYKFPPNTILLPVPTFFILFSFLKKLMNSFNLSFFEKRSSLISWVSFNYSLKLLSIFFNLQLFKRLVIIHYHFHQPFFRVSNSFIFSHGVEWQRPPKSKLDHMRMDSLKSVVNDKCVKGIIANDHDYIKEVERVSFESKKIIFLPNPVDFAKFNIDNLERNNHLIFKRIVLIRNIRPDRGIYEAIESFIIFIRNEQFADWVLDIFGHFHEKDSYYLACQDLITQDLENNIKFCGAVNNSEVAEIYSNSSFSLVPSQSLEGTSLSALESMACGIPCVSTPIGGLLDLPTLKSKTISPIDIASAMTDLVKNFNEIRNKQIVEVKKFSLESWNDNFKNILMEN